MKHALRAILVLLSLVMIGLTPLTADDLDSLFGDTETTEEDISGSSDGGDALFSGGSLVEDVVETDKELSDILLTNEDVVVIGGSYSFSLAPSWAWSFADQSAVWGFSTDLRSKLYLDARPSSDTRFYAKAVITYPFTEDADRLVPEPEPETIDEGRGFDDIISIKELFGDFNIDDTVFFRVGKQTLNWGVGYFFSPANLLNITQIDPMNADAELEGPVSVKMNMPIGIDNLYGYLIVPESTAEPIDLAYAAKYEKVIGGSEIGIGAYYRYDHAPAVMATLSTTIDDVMIFGEGVVRYGSDISYSTGPLSFHALPDDRFYASATAGFMFSWSAEESDFGIALTGQYYFNGEGYDGNDLAALPPVLSGFHYVGANLSCTLTDELSTGVLWYGNMTDLSGMVTPSITWRPLDDIRMSLGATYSYGDPGDQFTPSIPGFFVGGSKIIPTLKVSLGGAGF